MAVGRLVLNRDIRALIDTYLQQDAEGAEQPRLFLGMRARREAIEQTMARVEEMARTELGLD
jgi:hypothetical protein